MTNQAPKAQKSKRETIRDRAVGIVMIVAGIILTIIGLKEGHISMVWPIVGLAGIALFTDSFLVKKSAKITLNIAVILALAAVYFSVKNYNSTHEPAAEPQNSIEITQ